MATVKIDSDKNSNKEMERLLKEVAQLKMPDFEDFIKKALKILEKRKSPEYKKKEKELIDKIKNGGPSEKFWKKFDLLASKLEQETITEIESEEFRKHVEIMEKWTYDRILLMTELAELWDAKLQDIPKRLKLKHRERVYA